jgi:hypothetical protein
VEPKLKMDAGERAVLAQLKQREPVFHRPEFAAGRAELEAMTDPDFWEIGASGRRYSRSYVLDTVAARTENPVEDEWQASEFHCRELAPDLYLLSYTLLQGERCTRRTSLWRRSALGWQVLFHQGTIVED